jgi:hypothetical protein
MLTETQCRREDVRVGDEILVPRSAWRIVQAIALEDEILWVTFIDGSRHGFGSGVLVTVRRARAAAPALTAQPRARAAAPTLTAQPRARAAAPALTAQPRARAAAPALMAQPLDFNECNELRRLRQCELHVPAMFASEREELDALRAEFQRELAKVRTLTEDQPLAYPLDPVSELSWRRPLAEQKRKADEAAREEKARKEEARLASERRELHRLRQCKLHVPAMFASEREELDALRAEFQRELAEARALTEAWPLVYVDDPVEELFWRRPLAEQRRKADEAAREEEARKERDAEQARLTYERQQRDEEGERAHRIAAAHTTLTAAERQEEDALRKNWEEHGALCEENGTEPIYSTVGDCGREHLSLLAACACANVRQKAVRAMAPATTKPPTRSLERVYAPTQPRPAPPTHLAVAAAARPAPSLPTRSAAARPATLHLVSEPRPVPVPAPLKRVPSPPSGTGSGAVPAAREPVPAAREPVPDRRAGTGSRAGPEPGREPVPARPSEPAPPSRRALILDAVRSSATPLSANAIATTVGGRKAAVLEEVRALVREGVLVSTEVGLIPR